MIRARLLVMGAGGHGRSVAEATELTNTFQIVGFLDDALPAGEMVLGYPVLGAIGQLSEFRTVCDQAIVAIGNNFVRETLVQQTKSVGLELTTIIHPKAFVSPRAHVSIGTAVMAGAIIGTEARLGVGSIINCGAVVDHHAQVEDFGHLGVNACMAGGSVLVNWPSGFCTVQAAKA